MIKSLWRPEESEMDHTFYGKRVSEMTPEQLEEAKGKGLSQDVIDLYTESDPFDAILDKVSKTASKAIREAYGDIDSLRADIIDGSVLTVKGVSQKAVKTITANLEK
jgi:hypothetical protein